MKLDIEAVAQAAWLAAEGPKRKDYQVGSIIVPMEDMRDELIKELTPALEAFARLIVERCAAEVWSHVMHTGDADKASTAIRNLLED